MGVYTSAISSSDSLLLQKLCIELRTIYVRRMLHETGKIGIEEMKGLQKLMLKSPSSIYIIGEI